MSDKPAEGEPEINAEPVAIEPAPEPAAEKSADTSVEVAPTSEAPAPDVVSDVVDAVSGRPATVETAAPEVTPTTNDAAVGAGAEAMPEAVDATSEKDAAADATSSTPDAAKVEADAPAVDGAVKDGPSVEAPQAAEGGTTEAKTDEGKTDEGKTDEGKTDEGKTTGSDADGQATDGKSADGKTADGKTADGKTADGAADGKATDGDPKRDEMFKVYGDTLDSADWAFKAKTGDEREIGHKSVMLAEKAYISAGLYDKDQADKMWSEATGRPPKAELQQRLAEAQGVDPSKGIADLSASLTTLQQKQKVNSISLNRDAADKQIATWEGALGDHQARQRDFRHKAADELLKPEAPDRNDEGGLGMFLRSIKGGYRAGKDINMAAQHGKRFSEVSENKFNAEQRYASLGEDLKKAQGVLTGEPADFVAEQGSGLEATTGDVGKNSRRFPAVRNIVDKVMANKLAASMNKTPVQSAVEAVVKTEKADTIDPARRNFIMAGMADQGRGMGG
jgi:hypothetical protein